MAVRRFCAAVTVAFAVSVTPAYAAPKPASCPTTGRALCVELGARRVRAVENGVTVWQTTDVRFGRPETPTPVGTFRVTRLHPAWTSPFAKGGPPDMKWSVFTSAGKFGGVAFHQSAGYPALNKSYRARHREWLAGGSSGCINLGPNDARTLYQLIVGWVAVDPVKGGNSTVMVTVVILA